MLEELIAITKEAGEIIKDGFNAPKDITHKGSIDLVTQYDVKVEKFLLEKLSKLFPDFMLIAEESYKNESPIKNRIYIDPIDGTTNFVHSIPFVAISIGVVKNNELYLAVVYNPILDECYSAQKSMGASLNGVPIHVNSTNHTILNSLIATGFPYAISSSDSKKSQNTVNWVMPKVEKILTSSQGIRRLGSAALDLCYVARGSFEGYYEAFLLPWDVSAGILIVQEAGGIVTTDKNRAYNLDKDNIVVATNSHIHKELLDLLKS